MFTKNLIAQLLLDAPVVNAPSGTSSGGSGSGTGEIGGKDTTADDLALLNSEGEEEVPEEQEEAEHLEEAEEEEKPKKVKKEAKVEEDDEEEEELEEEDEEKKEKKPKQTEEEEDEELEAAANGDELKKSTYKSIKKAFPDFFKKFPALKNDLFRAQAYGAVFPSVEDAKEAAQLVANYNEIRDVVTNGETDKFLAEVKEVGDEQFNAFTEKFLPSLYSLNKDKYYDVVTPVIRASLKSIVKRGIALGGKIGGTENNQGQNLINAAIVAHIDLFGNSEVEADDKPLASENKSDKKDPEREKFDKERQEFLKTKHDSVRQGVEGTVKSTLISEITKGLDPNNTMPAYVRDNLVRDIFLELDSTVAKNESHMNLVNSLWKKELASGFSGTNKDRLINAILSAARPLIPGIRQRLKTKALEGISSSKPRLLAKEVKKTNLAPQGAKKVLPKTSGKSDLDIINED